MSRHLASISILLFLLSFKSIYAQEMDSLFTVANESYQQNDFQKAHVVYEGLIREGLESADLYFNYANTSMHQDEFSVAIAYYYKTLKLLPNDIQVLNNLQYAQKKLGISEQNNTTFLSKLDSIYLYSLSIIAIWLSILTILSIYVLVNPVKRKKFFAFSSILIFITVFAGIVSFLRYQEENLHQYAVVIQESEIYRQSSNYSPEVYDVFDGQKVKVLKQEDGWVQIRTEKNKMGWIKSEYLILI